MDRRKLHQVASSNISILTVLSMVETLIESGIPRRVALYLLPGMAT